MDPAELKSLTILYEKIGKLDSKLIYRYGDQRAFQKAQKAPKISWIDPDKGEVRINDDESLQLALKISRKTSLFFNLIIRQYERKPY